jgi:hypothetical protein
MGDWRTGAAIFDGYNSFERKLELPADLEGAQVRIEEREGILLVRLICGDEAP